MFYSNQYEIEMKYTLDEVQGDACVELKQSKAAAVEKVVQKSPNITIYAEMCRPIQTK